MLLCYFQVLDYKFLINLPETLFVIVILRNVSHLFFTKQDKVSHYIASPAAGLGI